MNNVYNNLTEKKFKILTILTCFFGDFTVLYWLWKQKEAIFNKYLEYIHQVLEIQGGPNIPKNFEEELLQLMAQSLLIMFTGIMIAHGIIYLTYWFDKKFSKGYLKFYTSTAAVGCLIILISSPLANLQFSILTFFYAFSFFGLMKKKEQ